MNSLKTNLLSATFWSLIGQFGYLSVSLVVNIILARLLTPSEFGQIGIVLFFIIIARVLTESGLGGALVRNNNATSIDFSTIFIFNLAVAVILCVFIIGIAGFVSDFYEDDVLKPLLVASSFILIINAFQFVQNAKLIKKMQFRKKAIYDFIAIFLSGIVGIVFALNGFGVWSLVIMQILGSLILVIILWHFEEGIKELKFSKDSFRSHYKFGVNTTLATVINSIFDNIYHVILAKFFTISQTGYYFQAKKLQEVPIGIINKLTESVVFSGLVKIQDDLIEFKEMYQKIIRYFLIFSAFTSIFIFSFAEELIVFLLGSQWYSATFFLQVLVFIGFFQLQENFNRVLFKIYNDTKYIIYLELVKKLIQTLTIIVGLLYRSINILMIGFLIASISSYFINYYFKYKKYQFLGNTELNNLAKISIIIIVLAVIQTYIVEVSLVIRLVTLIFPFTFFIFYSGLIKFSDLNNLTSHFLKIKLRNNN